MKTLKDLKGVKELNKNEQKSINGGRQACGDGIHYCASGYCCSYGACVRYGAGELCQVQP